MNGNCGSQNNVYIGARYVPKIVGEWSADIAYEPLTVVLYQGTSYTSITYVPKGIIPSESTKQYWALTGNYNAQVEQYRQEMINRTNELDLKITDNKNEINTVKSTIFYVTPQMYGAIGDGVTDDTKAFTDALSENKELYIPSGTYVIEDLNIGENIITGNGIQSVLNVKGKITINSNKALLENFSIKAIGTPRDCLIEVSSSYHVDMNKLSISTNLNNIKAIYFNGETHCYYNSITNCNINNFDVGVHLYHYANAITIDNNEFYLCDKCIVIESCDGNRITSNTFQSFKISGVKLEYNETINSPTNGNVLIGNYFEYDSNSLNTTYVGDIDLSNGLKCYGNYFIGNQWTYAKSKSHVVNEGNNANFNMDNTNKDNSVPNTYMGFNKFEIRNSDEFVYGGNNFQGVIAPFKEENGNINYYLYGKKGTNNVWQRLITNQESINEYIRVGYDFTGTISRALTYDTNQKLLKIYEDSKWNYIQKCDAGTTEQRPTYKPAGYVYFDRTLNKPIFSTGTNTWVDANGSVV